MLGCDISAPARAISSSSRVSPDRWFRFPAGTRATGDGVDEPNASRRQASQDPDERNMYPIVPIHLRMDWMVGRSPHPMFQTTCTPQVCLRYVHMCIATAIGKFWIGLIV